jgi:glycosyltransferase involved in cell wall biosynthesis
MFVKTALMLLKERRDVVFFVVGDGPDKVKVERLVPLNLKPFFKFTGKIRNVEEVVSLFDVAILASFGEGTSNSLLEYMLLKKPVVATDVSGINEVVVNGVTGYLVPQNNIQQMKSRVDELLGDPEKCQKMGLSGNELVALNYSIKGMVGEYEAVYEKVLKK